MKFVLIALIGILSLNGQAFAQEDSAPTERNEKKLTAKQASCTKKVITIAKAVEYISENKTADNIKSVEVYSDQAGDYVKEEQHIYSGGASELVVIMLPNYYGDGKCKYSSSYIYRD